jgi:hypothetical protein
MLSWPKAGAVAASCWSINTITTGVPNALVDVTELGCRPQ